MVRLITRINVLNLINRFDFDLYVEIGTLHEVRLTDCSKMPCKIVRGKEYKVEIDFTPSLWSS